MSRLPITLRLTLVFAAVTAAILAATGLFVHARLSDELDRTVQESLRSRADDVVAFLHRVGPGSAALPANRLTEAQESFSQVIDRRDAVVAATPAIGERPLLTSAELRRARESTFITDRRAVPHWEEERLRLLATPIVVGEKRLVAIVGMSMEDQHDALQGHVEQLLVGGAGALLLATLSAFGLARAALRPVESL